MRRIPSGNNAFHSAGHLERKEKWPAFSFVAHHLILLLILTYSPRIEAFESWEHRQLSALAYALALDMHCMKNQGETRAKDCGIAARLLATWNGNGWASIEAINYGDITMCVDFFLTPDKMIAGRETSLVSDGGTPRRPLYPTRGEDLDMKHLSRCKDELFNYDGMRAMHVNHTHFQAELLVAQRNNHMLALSLRTVERNLYSALLFNAISDHFLHDSFAPGHITSWRNRLTDLAANAYHDKHNRNGWVVAIDPDELRDFLKFTPIPDDQRSLPEWVAHRLKAVDEYKRTFFVPQQMDKEAPCRGECRIHVEPGVDSILEQMGAAFDGRILANDERDETTVSVDLRGDSFLWSRFHDRQRFLMLLVQIRSIMDVLESRTEDGREPGGGTLVHVVDSFTKSSWDWRWTDKESPSRFTIADSDLKARIGPVSYSIPHRATETVPPEQKVLTYRNMDPIIGIGLGTDNMVFGDAQTRYTATLETVVYGLSKARRNENQGLTVGLQPYLSRDFNGLSFFSRVIFMKPEIETAISIPFRLVHVRQTTGRSTWRPSVGLRLDAGFTSFLTFYIQVNWDVAAQKDGRLRYGPSIGGGLQLAAPKCRVPWLQKIADCGIPARPSTRPNP